MVKTDYRYLCGLCPSRDVPRQSPSSSSNLADSSENGMDPINPRVTPGSGGDANGSRSARTSSRWRRRLTLSSPAGTELLSEFDAAADGPGSGSSLSSAGPDIEADETPYRRSRSRANPEDSPTANNLGCLLLVSPVRSQASTDDDVLIMDGVLVDSEPSTPSSARRPVSLVDDNGPSNRRSVSIADLVLVSSGSQGSSGDGNTSGSGGRRSGGQLQRWVESRGTQGQRDGNSEVGSPSRPRQTQAPSPFNNHQQVQGSGASNIQRPAQGAGANNIHRPARGAGASNIQQRQELPLPHNFQRGPELPHFPPNFQQQGPPFPPNFHLGHFPANTPYFPTWVPPPPPYYTYAPLSVTIPLSPYRSPFNFGRTPPVYPPPGVTIKAPVERPPPPPRRSDIRVVIRDPDEPLAGEGGSSAPAKPEASKVNIKAPPGDQRGTWVPKQSETKPPSPPPLPMQLETQKPPPPPAQKFWWPPTSAESAAITQVLYGPSSRPRLPVFRDICPDDDEPAQPPTPSPPASPSPSPPASPSPPPPAPRSP